MSYKKKLYLNLWWPWFDKDVQHANLLNNYITTCNGYEYIVIIFNMKTKKTILTICVYKGHYCLIYIFLDAPKALVKKSPNDSPLVILENFNIDMLKYINHKKNKKQVIDSTNIFKLKSQLKNNTTKVGL